MKPYLTPLKATAFALCIALFACNAPTESTLPTSSGFSPEDGPVYFGSEASVQLVKDIDAAWAAEEMEQLSSFFADTCVFDWHDGNRYEGPEGFIGRIMADTLDHDWTFNWAYAVDANLEEAGDWVHAGFDVKTTQDSVLVEHAWFQEWYYIEGGKVLYWYNMKGTRPN
jgi:hypothetical protein